MQQIIVYTYSYKYHCLGIFAISNTVSLLSHISLLACDGVQPN